MQLIDSAEKAPYDLVVKGDTRKYGDLLTQASIQDIATYADGISPHKLNLINVDSAGAFQTPSDVIRFAHDAGLLVHSWTFRPENNFLPAPLKLGQHAHHAPRGGLHHGDPDVPRGGPRWPLHR